MFRNDKHKIFLLIVGLLALSLSACSGGGNNDEDSISPHDGLRESAAYYVVVDFPPSPARHTGAAISVRGHLSDAPYDDISIEIDAGAGVVTARLEPDGNWLAEAVPLSDEEVSTVRLDVRNNGSLVGERIISTLDRSPAASTSLPWSVTRATTPGNFVLAYIGSLLVEVNQHGSEMRRYQIQAEDSPQLQAIQPIPASQELLVPVTQHAGSCLFLAVDLEQQSERELFRIEWEPRGPVTGSCSYIDLAVHYDRIVVIDKFDNVVMAVNFEGEVLSRADNQLPTTYGEGLFLREDSVDTAYYLVLSQAFTRARVSATEVYSFDISSGATIDYFFGEVIGFWDQRPARTTHIEDGIYYIVDDTPGVLDLNPVRNRFPQESGYKANGVTSIFGGAGRVAVNLDDNGRVSSFDTDTGRGSFLFDLAPFNTGYLSFSDHPRVNGEILLHQVHTQSHLGCCSFNHAFPVSRQWHNLYVFHPESLTMRQQFATYGPVNGLGDSSRLQSMDFSIEAAPKVQQPPLLQINHMDGSRTPLAFEGLPWYDRDSFNTSQDWLDQYSFVTGLGGEFIVVTGPDGISEYNIATLKMTRHLHSQALSDMADGIAIAARFPGQNGVVYAVNENLNTVYRADFDNGQLVPLSGSGAGEGPRLQLNLSQDNIMHWSVADNALFIASSEDLEIWQIDLPDGKRQRVFLRRDNGSEYPYAINSMYYLPEQQVMLASSFGGLYMLDIITGESVGLSVNIHN